MLSHSAAQSKRLVRAGIKRATALSAHQTHRATANSRCLTIVTPRDATPSNLVAPLTHRRMRPGSNLSINTQIKSIRPYTARSNGQPTKLENAIPLTEWEQHSSNEGDGQGNNNNRQNKSTENDWWWAGKVSAMALILALVCACTTPRNSAHSEKSPRNGRVSLGKDKSNSNGVDSTKDTITTKTKAGDDALDTKQQQKEGNNNIETYGSLKEFRARFKPLKVLGEGTFAVVRMAKDRKTKERVAVKEIDKDLSDEDALESEIQVMKATGRHENIISLRSVYDSGHTCYLVIDLAEGGELFDHIIDHGELSERRASKMFHDAIQGLAHLHARKICHLDIKPENLLLTSTKDDAKVKIADFGLAITMQDNERCEACVGTPAYWAPEMVRREPFGRPVDIWALGCVLYIMLVGTHPFDPEGDSPEAHILARVTEGDYDKESIQYKQLSNTVKDLINHMLDPNHKTRYTADKVLAHPWLSHADQLSDAPLYSSHISNLRGFRVLHLLKSGIPELVDKASNDLFSVFDLDGDGMLNREELIAALRMVGHGATGTGDEKEVEDGEGKDKIRDKAIDDVLGILDLDGDGLISREDFDTVLSSVMESSGNRASIHDMESLFKIFDRSQDGYIYKDDFRHVLSLLGAPPSDTMVSNELMRADLDNDGKVDFAEFVSYVRLVEDTRIKMGYASVSSIHMNQAFHGLTASRNGATGGRRRSRRRMTRITTAPVDENESDDNDGPAYPVYTPATPTSEMRQQQQQQQPPPPAA